jgi:hypothetical protein
MGGPVKIKTLAIREMFSVDIFKRFYQSHSSWANIGSVHASAPDTRS